MNVAVAASTRVHPAGTAPTRNRRAPSPSPSPTIPPCRHKARRLDRCRRSPPSTATSPTAPSPHHPHTSPAPPPAPPATPAMHATVIERDRRTRPSCPTSRPPRRQRRRPPDPRRLQRRRHRHRLTLGVGRPLRERVGDRHRSAPPSTPHPRHTPSRHNACVTDGAAGVTSSHDAPYHSPMNVAVAASTRVHPRQTAPNRDRRAPSPSPSPSMSDRAVIQAQPDRPL